MPTLLALPFTLMSVYLSDLNTEESFYSLLDLDLVCVFSNLEGVLAWSAMLMPCSFQ